MNKVISSQCVQEGLSIAYENSVKSFLKSMWFYIDQLKLPTLAVRLPYAIVSSENDWVTKGKVWIGIGMMFNSLMMILNKSMSLNKNLFHFMFNINSVSINSIFTSIILDSSISKINFIRSGVMGQLNPIDKQDVQSLLTYQFVSELFFSSAAGTGGFALLDLTETKLTGSINVIKQNTCLIKAGLFMSAQCVMSLHHQKLEHTSQITQKQMALTRNIVYEDQSGEYVYLKEFFWSSIFFNSLLMGFSIATKIESCDGPLGPNGEQTCLADNPGHQTLYFLQMLFNLWLATSFLRKGLSNTNDHFRWANQANEWIYNFICGPVNKVINPSSDKWPVEDDIFFREEECKV